MNANERAARLAGGIYLVTIGCGVYAEAIARGDVATAAQSMLNDDTQFRSGLIANLAMLASYVVVTVLFYGLFRSVSKRLSSMAAAFSMIGIAVLACDTLILAMILKLPDVATIGSTGPDVAPFLLRVHGDGYKISLVFFGIYCLLLGWLIWRSHFMPKVIAVMVAAAGACNLANSLLWLGAPQWARHLPSYFTLPTLLGELALALWLFAFGIRDRSQPADEVHLPLMKGSSQ